MKKIKILNGDIEKLSNASQYPFSEVCYTDYQSA